MEAKPFRVVRQGEAYSVQSKNNETGSIQKCNIVLRELGGSKFENEFVCAMLGNYSQEDFNKMKDYYWLCLSIINKVVQLDLEELHFAPYLYEEHENTPSINNYKNREGESIMERLSVLKSVIKGETLLG